MDGLKTNIRRRLVRNIDLWCLSSSRNVDWTFSKLDTWPCGMTHITICTQRIIQFTFLAFWRLLDALTSERLTRTRGLLVYTLSTIVCEGKTFEIPLQSGMVEMSFRNESETYIWKRHTLVLVRVHAYVYRKSTYEKRPRWGMIVYVLTQKGHTLVC